MTVDPLFLLSTTITNERYPPVVPVFVGKPLHGDEGNLALFRFVFRRDTHSYPHRTRRAAPCDVLSSRDGLRRPVTSPTIP